MRLKLLLLLVFASCMVYAQEPYRNLIFSEVRMDQSWYSYCELTNMGDKTINLSEFEFGVIGPWTAPWTTAGSPSKDYRMRLPNKTLAPGKSFLISVYWNLPDALSPIDPEKWIPRKITPDDMKAKADLLVSEDEKGQYGSGYESYDIITPGWRVMDIWWGRDCWFLRHFYSPTDSVVVDAVNASFNNTTSPYKSVNGSDVAGVPAGTDANPGQGTGGMILVRKYSIKQGVGDAIDSWTKAKGVDITDSEWLPIPLLSDSRNYPERMVYWTVGNHGNYLLNSTTLQSTTVKQDWVKGTLTVDYGARKLDGLMKQFTYKPGLAWFYKNAPTHADSAFNSVRTGDTLIVYSVGTTLLTKKFALIAAEPGADAKVVIPKNGFNPASNSWGGHRSL